MVITAFKPITSLLGINTPLTRNIHSVVCALSGGVDSAVSAYLLKQKGFQVKGVYMTNWDPLDEGMNCSTSTDKLDAQFICDRLQIPFFERNFVKEYWNYVFLPLLESYKCAATPNPDILCNRFIKFNLLTKEVFASADKGNLTHELNDGQKLKADAIATGHYCNSSFGSFLENADDTEIKLLRSSDLVKDQTFWLSTVSHKQLEKCMFPIGGLSKPQVKRIAKNIGLTRIATKRESMGMCFIGKRRFTDFIDSYLEPRGGVYKCLESGIILGEHNGVHHYTLGQRTPIKQLNGPFYVAKMDGQNQIIYVVKGPDHPSLYMRRCCTGPAVWINSKPPVNLESSKFDFQWQNKWRPITCSLTAHNGTADAMEYLKQYSRRDKFAYDDTVINTIDVSTEQDRHYGPCLSIELENPMRCITIGQWAALYNGQTCLGGAMICGTLSLWDEGQTAAYTGWHHSDYELSYEKILALENY